MSNLLTILPCLKGREFYTERYLGLARLFSYHHHILLIQEKGSRNILIPSELKTLSIRTEISINGMSDIFKAIADSEKKIIHYDYCHFVEDDNFVFADSLLYLSNILDKSPEYSGAVGNSFIYDKKNYKILNNYKLPSLNSNNPLDRLKDYISQGGLTYYSLFRSEEFIQICIKVRKVSDHNMSELAFNTLTPLRCKIKFCNVLFLAREYPRPKVYNVPQSLDWLTNKQFSNELNNIVKVINEELIPIVNFSKNQEVFDLTLANYFRSRFAGSQPRFSINLINLIKKISFINNKDAKKMLRYIRINLI